MAMKKIAGLQNPVGGKGLALAGLICGYIGSLLSLVTIGFVVFVLNATDGGIQEIIENMERQQSENQERIEESQRQVEDAGENAH
jgi:ABC-type microcin C transport system permease subunit YejB